MVGYIFSLHMTKTYLISLIKIKRCDVEPRAKEREGSSVSTIVFLESIFLTSFIRIHACAKISPMYLDTSVDTSEKRGVIFIW